MRIHTRSAGQRPDALRRSIVLGLPLSCALASLPAGAQTAAFPSRAVRIVVGFPPGGSSDGAARIVAEKLAAEWGVPVVVENRPGAGSTIATAMVASAPADGYTLLLIAPGTHAVSAALYSKLSYDPVRSFSSISQVGVGTYFVLVNAASRINTLKDLVDAARAAPGSVSYASTGNGSGSHLVAESLALATGVKFLHAPYSGAAPATLALLSDQVGFAISDVSAVPHLQSGKLKALAVTSKTASALFPSVPTVAAAGFPQVEYVLSVGLVGPAGIPRDVVAKISASTARALANEDARRRMSALGFEAQASTPEEYGAVVAADVAKFAVLVKAAGLKAD